MNAGKRVVILSGIFPPDIGGPASYVPKLSQELQITGFQVVIGTYAHQTNLQKEELYKGAKVIKIRRDANFILREIFSFLYFFNLARNCEVIISCGHFFKCFIIGKILGIPIVGKIVGDEAWERSVNQGIYGGTLDDFQVLSKGFRVKYFKWLRGFPVRFFEKLIVPSEYLKRIVSSWGVDPSRVQVIYNGFNAPKFNSVSSRDSSHLFEVITVCRLVPWKGVEGILLAVKNNPQLSLSIVGDGPDKKNLQNIASKWGISDRVRFLGNLSHNESLEKIMRAQVFVLNSSYEGLPHVVLEAMGLGTLVIASLAGGTGEVAKAWETALTYDVGDQDALEKHLKFSFDKKNELLLCQIKEKAKSFVNSQFNEVKMWNETLALVKSCMKS